RRAARRQPGDARPGGRPGRRYRAGPRRSGFSSGRPDGRRGRPRGGGGEGMNELVRGYVGLGSNLGDRLGNLRRALLRLAGTPGVRVVRVSPVYETAPWGYLNQPAFLNAVAEVESALGPIQLATALQAAERGL